MYRLLLMIISGGGGGGLEDPPHDKVEELENRSSQDRLFPLVQAMTAKFSNFS